MNEKIHPQMMELLKKLFPDSDPNERYQDIVKKGEGIMRELEMLEKKER